VDGTTVTIVIIIITAEFAILYRSTDSGRVPQNLRLTDVVDLDRFLATLRIFYVHIHDSLEFVLPFFAYVAFRILDKLIENHIVHHLLVINRTIVLEFVFGDYVAATKYGGAGGFVVLGGDGLGTGAARLFEHR
jgi:hypothetical protein